MVRGQGEGEVANAGVVGGAGGGGEAEPGAGVDDQAGGGGGLAAGAFADAGLPRSAHRGLQAPGEVGTWPADLVFDVSLDGALGDTEGVGDRAGALELHDQVTHLRTGRLGDGRVNACWAARFRPPPTVPMWALRS